MCVAVLRRDARAAVGDVEHQLRVRGARLQVDGAALGRVLDGVRHQVLEDQADLAAVGDEGDVLDLHIEAHALRQQRQLLVLQHLLDQRPQPEFGRLQADAGGLPGAEGQQVLDHALQLDAVLAQDRGDLALVGVELARPPRPSAARCPRGCWRAASSARATCAAGSGCAPCASSSSRWRSHSSCPPSRSRSWGPAPRWVGEVALAELADGAVELAQRPADAEGQHEDRRPPPAAAAAPPATAAACARSQRALLERRDLARRPGHCSAPRRCSTSAVSCVKRSERSAARRRGPRAPACSCTVARMLVLQLAELARASGASSAPPATCSCSRVAGSGASSCVR